MRSRNRMTGVVVALASVLAGCGKGSDEDVGGLGSWELDPEPTIAANLPGQLAEAKEGLAKLEKSLKEAEEKIAKAPQAKQEELRKEVRDRLLLSAWTDERKALVEAMLRSRAEAEALVETHAKANAAKLATMKVRLTLAGDQTATMRTERDGEIDVGTGTWSRTGDDVSIDASHENGVPVAEKRRKPQKFTLRADRLVVARGKQEIFFRRVPGRTDVTLDPAFVAATSLVTADEVAAVVGSSVRAEAYAMGEACDFYLADDKNPVVSVWASRRKPDAAKEFRADLEKSKQPPVEGVGALAYRDGYRGLRVLKGDVVVSVHAYKPTPGPGKADDPEAEKAYARKFLSRLP